jgi:tetratricopeptide (TPR) repeat protein
MLAGGLTISQGSLLTPFSPGYTPGDVELADRIRDLRTQAGLSKTALANPRYTLSYVSQIEAGRRTPSPEALAFFAERLEVSPRYLATGIPEDIEDRLSYRIEEGRAALRRGRPHEALDVLGSVKAQAEEYALPAVRSQAMILTGDALIQQGKLNEAVDVLEEAREGGGLSPRDEGLVVAALARAYRLVGDLAYAAEVAERFLARADHGPLDLSVVVELQSVLISVYFERGDMLRAERAARRALLAAPLITSLEQRARIYWYVGRVLTENKKWGEALEAATRARVIMEELEDRRSVARLHNAYAFICLETDPPRTEEAREHLAKAEALLVDLGAPGDLLSTYTERARLALVEEEPEVALEFAERALQDSPPEELERARALYLKGRILGLLGRTAEARPLLRDAVASFRRHGARQEEASCWRELGELDLAEGDLQAAVDSLRAGLEALDPRRTRA